LDPCVLYGDYNLIKHKTKEMLNSFAGHRHIANLGHGVYPDISPDHVKCFIETVKSN
ncbi:MAG: uroporphyrinogen decarboxylase family protein, partial [Bacteroidota bacterium]|nr:uroporphyrinogen decarboxylase family protein [Bacteroidota bacterium]